MSSPFIWDWVEEHARRQPDAPAVATPDARLSYAELRERASRFAAVLAASGVAYRDRVIVALPNSVATVVADLALHALGACVVGVNRTWSPDALRSIVARSGARTAIVLPRDSALWSDSSQGAGLATWVVGDGPGRTFVGARGSLSQDGLVDADVTPDVAPPPVTPRVDDAAVILFTSGSTGRPHGVVQTWRNLHANTRSIVAYLGLSSADRALLVLPLSYCYGRSVLQTHLFVGGSVFMDNRFMYPRVVLESAIAEGCTGFAGVPATFELIRRQVALSTLGPLPFRYVTQAGEAMAPETIRWAREAFAPARLFVMYGQTEATARLSYLPPELAGAKEGSIGIPIPDVELRVVDDAGQEVPDGVVGNLVARGENVTPGYLDEPDETARILRRGWLWTGDLARRDADGFFFHEGRSREILKIAGHRVSPGEIEEVILGHPDVAEAAVVGARDAVAGQVPAAFVVRRPGSAVTEAALRRYCTERVPAFKVPSRITFLDALPRSESGKILRRSLA